MVSEGRRLKGFEALMTKARLASGIGVTRVKQKDGRTIKTIRY